MTALAGAIMDHTWTMLASCCYAPNHLIFSALFAAAGEPQLFLYVVCSQSCHIDRAWACFIVLIAGGRGSVRPSLRLCPLHPFVTIGYR